MQYLPQTVKLLCFTHLPARRSENVPENECGEGQTGKRAAEHGVLATVHYYATKFPEPLKEESLVRTWKNAYTAELRYLLSEHGGFEQ